MKTLITLAVILFSGCNTIDKAVGPPQVRNNVSREASWDGDKQNSGILSTYPEGSTGKGVKGFLVTPYFHKRYEALVNEYGKRLEPPVEVGDGIRKLDDSANSVITPQAMVWFLDMNQWNNNDRVTK